MGRNPPLSQLLPLARPLLAVSTALTAFFGAYCLASGQHLRWAKRPSTRHVFGRVRQRQRASEAGKARAVLDTMDCYVLAAMHRISGLSTGSVRRMRKVVMEVTELGALQLRSLVHCS